MIRPADKSTALWVLRRLRDAGYEALFAGGCVRDMLLGRRASDYDIATNAVPNDVAKVFKRIRLVGAKFGVAMVITKGRAVEVATFRSDVSYSDGRRPDAVKFTTAREDALRRDFTINGMFYDPLAESLIDYVGGRDDIAAGVIRAIGQPGRRFQEDHLRMIRAVRFAGRLGFRLDEATADAIGACAEKITEISGERIFDELSKMLAHRSAAQSLVRLNQLGLACRILPELFDASGPLWGAAIWRAEKLTEAEDSLVMLGAILGELDEQTIRGVVSRWGASNDLKKAMLYFSKNLQQWRSGKDLPLCDLKRLMAETRFERLRRLWRVEELRCSGQVGRSRQLAAIANRIAPDQVSTEPLLTGVDLQKMGLKQGRRLGLIRQRLYDAQLNEQVSSRAEALVLAKKILAALPSK